MATTEKPIETKKLEHGKKEKAAEIGGFMVLKQMAAGSFARATAGALLIPIDTCKTRLQFQGSMAKGEVRQYKGFVDCFASIYKEEGISAFYRGFVFNSLLQLTLLEWWFSFFFFFFSEQRSSCQALVHCSCSRCQVRLMPTLTQLTQPSP